MTFETMIKEAKKVFDKNGKDKGVVTALLTDKENIYINICSDFCQGFGEKFCEEYSILKDMIAAGESRILKIVSVYKVGQQNGIEIPCAWYRQFIYDINNQNIDAEVMLGNGKIYSLETLVPSLIKERALKGSLFTN